MEDPQDEMGLLPMGLHVPTGSHGVKCVLRLSSLGMTWVSVKFRLP